MEFDQIRGGSALTLCTAPWRNLATIEQIVTNANAITGDGDGAGRPTETEPTQTVDAGGGKLSAAGSRYIVKTNGTGSTIIKPAVGHATNAEDLWGQMTVRGWKSHRPNTDRRPQYHASFICRVSVQGGDEPAFPSGGYSLMTKSPAQAEAADLNWCDIIKTYTGTDKSLGGVQIAYDPTDGAAVLVVNNAGFSHLEVEMSCTLESSETGSACSSMTGCYTQV